MYGHRQVLSAAFTAALLLGLSACHGTSQSGSGYVPSAAQQNSQIAPQSSAGIMSPASSAIHASCKTPIRVGLDKDKTCHFNETGYKGQFTITENLGGVAVVRPHQGNSDTPFIVRGLAPGTGTFDVSDSQGNKLHVSVTVPQQPIVSSCGRKIQIHILGIVTCQFHELGYDGQFTIESHLNGIASVSPDHGDKHTQFTVTGLVEGGGYFIVHGARNLRVQVLVTTP